MVPSGEEIIFTTEARGDELYFQWQKDSQHIDSSNSRFSFNQTDGTSALKIQCVKKSDEGYYKCLVKNPVEQQGNSSSEAELRVCEFQGLWFCIIYCLPIPLFSLIVDPPHITRNPENQSVTTGADVNFTAEATGDELRFQWQKDNQDIDSSDSRLSFNQTDGTSALKIQCVKKRDEGYYKCLVKNPVKMSEKSSVAAKLIVGECIYKCKMDLLCM